MSGLNGLVLWGDGKPWFSLVGRSGDRGRRMDRLPGKFTFVNGSQLVTTTEDMREILASGDVLSPNRGRQARMYFVNAVNTAAQVKLSENFGEANTGAVAGYSDVSRIWMPDTLSTRFSFSPERADGGPIVKRLSNGKLIDRADGYRPRVVFSWEMLQKSDMKKLVTVLNFRLLGKIKVMPHEDVPMTWEMVPEEDMASDFTAGKLIGHAVTIGFVGVELIPDIPTASGIAGISPGIM